MTVTSKDGHFYYKASPKDEVEPGTTCGLYLITDPERLIEIELIHVDVSCENGGLISVSYLPFCNKSSQFHHSSWNI